jgi:hypothetical protein
VQDVERLVEIRDVESCTETSVHGGLQFEPPQGFARKISLLFEYYKGLKNADQRLGRRRQVPGAMPEPLILDSISGS